MHFDAVIRQALAKPSIRNVQNVDNGRFDDFGWTDICAYFVALADNILFGAYLLDLLRG